jgi:hypothetical protein
MSSDTTNNPSWGAPPPHAPPPHAATPYAPPPQGATPYAPPAGQWPTSPPPAWQPQQVVVQPQRTNGLSIAALVLGIVWVWWIGSILAVIFGHVSLSQIKKSNGAQGGKGMAIAGLVLGWIGVGTLLLVIAAAAANSGS